MELTVQQKEAVSHKDGPIMVLAGPGAGKTFVLTRRVQALIEQHQVNPSNILVVTFTRAAAMEMRGRFERLTQNMTGSVSFGTFHSIFFKIIRYAYNYRADQIVREEQKQGAMREIVRNLDLEIEDEKEFISSVLGEISLVKGEMMDLQHYYSTNCPTEVFRQIYQQYNEFLRQKRLIDFDDMQVICYRLFKEREDILSAWRRKYQYILVDEFQDICKLQYELVRMLAAPANNLFIVGDDDQSIYRFRGARPDIMLGFERDYPGAKKVLLDVNYRCDANIVAASMRLIHHNKNRFDKKIVADRPAQTPVVTKSFKDTRQEVQFIVDDIVRKVREGREYEECAVLSRTNRGAGQLVRKLMEYNLPFQMRDVLPNIYEHWICRDLLSYIRLGQGDRSRELFLRVANRPNRYIHRAALNAPQISLEDLYQWYRGKGWMIERIEKLEYDIGMLKKMSPGEAVTYIRKAVGYEDYIREYAKFRRMRPQELMEVLDELSEQAKQFDTFQAWTEHMREYTEELREQASHRREEAGGIVLATMHGAKGLEFPVVYVLDVNEGNIPYEKAALEEDMEEERRLFYVAMTRAKDQLYICCPQEKYDKMQKESRFVGEYLGRTDNGGKKTPPKPANNKKKRTGNPVIE